MFRRVFDRLMLYRIILLKFEFCLFYGGKDLISLRNLKDTRVVNEFHPFLYRDEGSL